MTLEHKINEDFRMMMRDLKNGKFENVEVCPHRKCIEVYHIPTNRWFVYFISPEQRKDYGKKYCSKHEERER